MALAELGLKFFRFHQNYRAVPRLNMYLHKNRKYIIENRRSYSKCPTESKPPEAREKDPCPSRNICPKKPPKRSFWKRLFVREKEEKSELPPDPACCKLRYNADQSGADPDLSQFGGQPYATCGEAYLIQKDLVYGVWETEPTKEELQLRKIEADPYIKDHINDDPMGTFKSTELRMLEMTDKKLHPLYKKYGGVKKRYIEDQKKKLYKTVSWPIDMHEIPARLNINQEIVQKKNMEYMEFKRIEPPRQLIERVVEMQMNARPTMERNKRNVPVDMREVELRRAEIDLSKSAFDTLEMQKGTKY